MVKAGDNIVEVIVQWPIGKTMDGQKATSQD